MTQGDRGPKTRRVVLAQGRLDDTESWCMHRQKVRRRRSGKGATQASWIEWRCTASCSTKYTHFLGSCLRKILVLNIFASKIETLPRDAKLLTAEILWVTC